MRLAGPPGVCRIALVATTALLLGGDTVEVDVHVGAGARLELSDVAATVAYHGRGRPASWATRIELAEGAEILYAGQPFVVADGAEVSRTLTVGAAAGASALIRETLILGREGEVGGVVRSRSVVRREGTELMIEHQDLEPGSRGRPGLLGTARVIDSLLALGVDPGPVPEAAVRFALLEPGSTLTRFVGRSLADSGVKLAAPAQPVEFNPIRLPSVSSK